MGFLFGAAVAAAFRTGCAVVGLTCATAGTLFPPSAPVMYPIATSMAAATVAPPGVNPVENAVVIVASGTPTP